MTATEPRSTASGTPLSARPVRTAGANETPRLASAAAEDQMHASRRGRWRHRASIARSPTAAVHAVSGAAGDAWQAGLSRRRCGAGGRIDRRRKRAGRRRELERPVSQSSAKAGQVAAGGAAAAQLLQGIGQASSCIAPAL